MASNYILILVRLRRRSCRPWSWFLRSCLEGLLPSQFLPDPLHPSLLNRRHLFDRFSLAGKGRRLDDAHRIKTLCGPHRQGCRRRRHYIRGFRTHRRGPHTRSCPRLNQACSLCRAVVDHHHGWGWPDAAGDRDPRKAAFPRDRIGQTSISDFRGRGERPRYSRDVYGLP